MKNLRFTILVFVIIASAGKSFSQEPRTNIKGDFLIKTQWGSDQFNTKYTPGNQPLGCHSIAIAQVLNYHRLAPHGAVNYKCSNGVDIKADFSDYKVDWDKISARLTESSGPETVNATAYYNYAVAAIVQKDFATDNYIDIENSENHKLQVESHFNCRYASYVYPGQESIEASFKKDQAFENIIKKELVAKRPVGLYYIWGEGGHAVVIDGYTIENDKFYVHVNFGWMGHSDGWYLFPEDLPDSTNLVMLLTIEPV